MQENKKRKLLHKHLHKQLQKQLQKKLQQQLLLSDAKFRRSCMWLLLCLHLLIKRNASGTMFFSLH